MSPTPIRKPIIKIESLTKEFGISDSKVKALDNVNLAIYAGEYVVFFGPSGCGKSTLLNCIAGLEVPSAGRVILRGDDLSKMTPKELAVVRNKKIGMVFQQFNVIKSFNVIKNISIPQLLASTPRHIRQHRSQQLLKMFDLEKIALRLPTEISGGQQQRVAIARALVNNPWIMVVDEPTGNLDSKAATEVMDLIKLLNTKSKRTVILVTHNAEYLHYADTVYYLKDGQIIKTERHRKKISQFDEKEYAEVKIA